jgi:regulator of RNase E activity RraA
MPNYSPTRPASIEADIWEMIPEVNISAVSDILHARGNHRHVMSHEIQALAPGTQLRGIARTMASSPLVGLPEPGHEYEKLFAAIDGLGAGDVLVTDSMDCCVWGELCSEAVMRRSGNGTVIDGFTRDSADIVRIGFPLFCRGRHMSDMLYHRQITDLDGPVICGGVTVHRGDLILGAEDGVLAVPAMLINAVVSEAHAKCTTESEVRVALRNGMSATDAYRRFGVM